MQQNIEQQKVSNKNKYFFGNFYYAYNFFLIHKIVFDSESSTKGREHFSGKAVFS